LKNLFLWSQELYHELHALDRFAQDYQHKRDEEDNSSAAQSGKNNSCDITCNSCLWQAIIDQKY